MAPAPNRRAEGLLIAWLVVDASMGTFLGLNGPSTISRILLAAGILLLLFVLVHRPPSDQQPTIGMVEVGLTVLLALELAVHVVVPFRPEPPAPSIPIPALAFVALVGLALWHAPRLARDSLRNASIGLAIGTALLARFAIIAFDVEPGFDVHLIQEAGGRALLDGTNPYLTHIYDSGYPYWPLAAVLAAVGLLAGDARWGLLVADVAMVGAFIAIARNVGAPARVAALAAALLLWNSSGLYMTWQSLPEPALIALVAWGIALMTRPGAHGWLGGVALGLAIATKQLALGLLPFLPLSRQRRQWVAFAVAGAVSAAVILPFFLWDSAAFLVGSVSSHLVEPARTYAVNLLDPLPGVVPRLNVPFVVTAAISLGIGSLVRLRWPDSIDGWLASSAALLIVAFSLIGISFVNYYQIPLALLLLVILIPDGWNPESRAPRAA